MTEVRPTIGDEIDLVDLFETLWNGRWKIIATTFTAALLGVIFSFVKPNSFVVSTHIQTAESSVFVPYTTLNNLLQEAGFLFDKNLNKNGYKFDSETIFESFIFEFNDYKEMTSVVSDNDFVKQSIKDLDETSKQRRLIEFAKSFRIIPPSNIEKKWVLQFEWHDDLEGRELFNKAILKTLKNVQEVAKNNIYELANIVEIQNSFKIDRLRNDLDVIVSVEKEKTRKEIQRLSEQSAIATALGIETNKLDANALKQSLQNEISLSINAGNVPYYLRGYKTINKEIALIESRSEEEMLLMADDYIGLKNEITLLENDLANSQLKIAGKLIESDNSDNWVRFELALADSQSSKKSGRYVAISILLGGLVGVMYVLVSNVIRKRKDESAKS